VVRLGGGLFLVVPLLGLFCLEGKKGGGKEAHGICFESTHYVTFVTVTFVSDPLSSSKIIELPTAIHNSNAE